MAKSTNPIDNLERSMHEPKRLAILSTVAAEPEGVSFAELKESCELTDGNLNRHLKVLEEESLVRLKKITGEGRARTMVIMTAAGRKKFIAYLDSLEAALVQAAQSAGRPVNLRPVSGANPRPA